MLAGLSGGGDSTALLLVLSDVARLQGRPLVAGIVDHALRPGSADSAAQAAATALALGAVPHVLTLDWPDGPRTAQAHARTARYAALARLARMVGTGTLFLGHTLDDQAETLLMRTDAGSGAHGMAGMAPLSPCPIWPQAHDLQLARPLLGRRRAALRDLLRAADVPWIEDPANALPRYARVRARAQLDGNGGAEALASAGAAQADAAAARDDAARDWLAAHARIDADRVSLSQVTAEEACIHALAAVAAAVGGAARAPAPAAAARVCLRLMGGQDGTLAGARFRAGPTVLVTRDPGGLFGRRGGGRRLADLPLPERETVVWDGRLALTARAPGWRAALPEAGGVAPVFLGPAGGDPPIASRWLVADRMQRLLWRSGPSAGA